MGGGRTFLSWCLAAVAAALAVVAIASSWADRQLLDRESFTTHSVQVLRDPQVQRLTAAFLADQLVAQQATTDTIAAALPESLKGEQGTAKALLHDLAERTALSELRARRLEPLWAEASSRMHGQFTDWLGGQRGAQVELDLQPILTALAQRVGVPQSLIDAAAAQAGNSAQIALIESGQFERTRKQAADLERLASAMLPATVVVAVLSVLVARRRRWATVRAGIAIAAAGLFVIAATPTLGDRAVSNLQRDGAAAPLASTIWNSLSPSLTQSAVIATAAGGGIALMALLLWPRTPAAPSAELARRAPEREPRRHPTAV